MYSREPFQGGTNQDIQRYLDQEFSKIEQYLRELETETIRLKISHSAPAKPSEAMIAYADGTDWDPGQGAGLYQYNGGWNGLLSITPAGLVSLTGTGLRFQADFSNSTIANRLLFQSSTTNGVTQLTLIPNGTSTTSGVDLINSTDTVNHSRLQLAVTSTEAIIQSARRGAGSYLPLIFSAGGAERYRIDTSGNNVFGTAALATNATNGFVYIPTCAGTPTGTPTAYTGMVPMVYDSTNNKFYIYNGAWKSVTLA